MFKAMIVDDEYDIREGIKNIIDWNKHGFMIVGEAEDGIEALEVFEREKPTLVITDIKMPLMDGLKLAKELRERNENVVVIILSGYNDFTYAKEAMKYGVHNYLLKPVEIEELTRELDSIYHEVQTRLSRTIDETENKKALRDYYLLKLVKGEKVDSKLLVEHGINYNSASICSMAVDLLEYGENLDATDENDIALMKFILGNIIEEVLSDSGGFFFEVPEHRYAILVFTNDTENVIESMKKLAELICNCVEKFAKSRLIIGIGNVVYSVNGISDSYEKAEKSLECSFFRNIQRFYVYDEIKNKYFINILEWDSLELFQHLKNGNFQGVQRELDVLFKAVENPKVSLVSVKATITYLFMGLKKIVIEARGDFNEVFSGRFQDFEALFEKSSAVQLIEDVSNICKTVFDCVQEDRKGLNNNSVDQVLQYIEGHYNEDINIKKLAEKFFINQFYLGQLIKKIKGEYFNDYLNSIRINKAMQLLDETSLSINEVCEKVGYKHMDHFYKKFKSITGINPGEYKKIVEKR